MSMGDDLYAGVVGIESDWAFIVECFNPDISGIPLDDKYVTVMCECRLCGSQDLTSYPLDIWDETCQECPNCGHMTAEPMTNDRLVVVDD